MAVSSPTLKSPSMPVDGMRPVNLRTDLAPLADLIELVFADTMDSGGQAALREMRTLSKFGPGLSMLARMNDMAQGISMGYVWIENGNLIGNVSVYPATMPNTHIIANVGVHPDYRGQGIARQLMEQSLQMIAKRGGQHLILQVDEDNYRARPLYQSLGFWEERIFVNWRRSNSSKIPTPADADGTFIRHRRRSEWRDEHQLAQSIRPDARGGLGWLRPLQQQHFKRGFWKKIGDALNMRGVERMVIEDDTWRIRSSLWVETALGTATQLTLLTPNDSRGIYDDILLNNVLKRYGRGTLTCEHPADDMVTSGVLQRYGFYKQRSVVHMRWDA